MEDLYKVYSWVSKVQGGNLSSIGMGNPIRGSELKVYLLCWYVDNGDSVLGTFRVNGYLAAGANYTKSVNIRVPERIFGAFYILVFTDVYNHVYEHTNENDNTGSSIVRKSTM